MKRVVWILLCSLIGGVAQAVAQQGDLLFRIQAGENGALGPYATFSLVSSYALPRHFSIEGGVQYHTMNRYAVEARPAYFHAFRSGTLSVEALLHYTRQGVINNRALGVGVGFDTRYVWLTLGYYHRRYWVHKESIREPFNIYYELGVNCLPGVESWDLMVIASNSQLFDLERHYQPSLLMRGWWYPMPCMGVMVGAGYKPAGMFHLSSEGYQWHGEIGISYRW